MAVSDVSTSTESVYAIMEIAKTVKVQNCI